MNRREEGKERKGKGRFGEKNGWRKKDVEGERGEEE